MDPIPLEENLNWWWYKAKSYLLKHILEALKISKNTRNWTWFRNNIEYLSGIGSLDVLETEKVFIEHLNSTFKNSIDKIYTNLNEISVKYDLIIMLDVLEHVEESQNFMDQISRVLVENGSIVIGVPAYQSLWSNHDIVLKHFRRYDWKTLYEECKSYEITKRYGLNYLLLPIRYIQIKTNKVTTTNETGKIVSSILFFIIVIEAFLRKIGLNPKFGISLYAILQKKKIK